MSNWKTALREGSVAGTAATLLSLLVLAAAGRQRGAAAAPVNAISHWLWGDESLHADRASLRHTAVGLLTHQAAAIGWATLYSRVHGHRPSAKQLPQALAGGVATSAVAFAVDYALVPKRLTPGYEHRLGSGAMLATYGSLAAGFALGALVLRALQD